MTTLDPELAAILRNLDSRVGNVEGQMDGMNGRLSNVEEQLGGMNGRLSNVDAQMDGMNSRLGNVEEQLGGMNGRLGNVEEQLGGMSGRLSRVEGMVEEQSKGQQDLRGGQRQIMLAQWSMGITITAGLFGTLMTLIFRLSGS